MILQTEQLDKLFKALSQAQSEYPTISSNRKAYTNNYADHYTILRQVYPTLKKYGLCVMPWAARIDGIQMVGARLGHESGQYIINSYEFIIDAVKTPQDKLTHKTAGALTYFKRYHVKDILGVLLSDDPEDDDQQGPYKEYNEASPSSQSYISKDQLSHLEHEISNDASLQNNIMNHYKINSLHLLPKDQYIITMDKIKGYKQKLRESNK